MTTHSPTCQRLPKTLLFGGVAIGVCFSMGSALLLALPLEEAQNIARENGPIESLSAVGWFLNAALVALIAFRRRWTKGYAAALLVTALGFRELDFNKRFTSMSIAKVRYYVSSKVPLLEKGIVILILLVFLSLAVYLLLGTIRRFIWLLRRRNPEVIFLFIVICFLPIAKVMDSLPAFLSRMRVVSDRNTLLRVGLLEEAFELAVPSLLMLFLVHVVWKDKAIFAEGDPGHENPRNISADTGIGISNTPEEDSTVFGVGGGAGSSPGRTPP